MQADIHSLLAAIHQALERSHTALLHGSEMERLRISYASLTPRERDVMALVVSGLLNKQVGGELGISEITVKAHRGQVMRKMMADSLPHLVTMAACLGCDRPQPTSTVAEHWRKHDDHERRPHGVHGQVGDLPSLQVRKRAVVA
jgi:DNA-binding CsgD family transcriptional regulator